MIEKETIIYQLYPNVKTTSSDSVNSTYIAKDEAGNLVSIDMDLVNAEFAKQEYINKRTNTGSTTYASFGDQLDMLYADMLAGKLDTTGTWATHIKAVKDANPKPS
jgi:hypothetical protein